MSTNFNRVYDNDGNIIFNKRGTAIKNMLMLIDNNGNKPNYTELYKKYCDTYGNKVIKYCRFTQILSPIYHLCSLAISEGCSGADILKYGEDNFNDYTNGYDSLHVYGIFHSLLVKLDNDDSITYDDAFTLVYQLCNYDYYDGYKPTDNDLIKYINAYKQVFKTQSIILPYM